MENELYYELTDNADMSVTAKLESCMEIIKSHMEDNGMYASEIEFKLNPCWLTEKEYLALGESQDY